MVNNIFQKEKTSVINEESSGEKSSSQKNKFQENNI